MKSWKKKFTQAEITHIRNGVEEVSKDYYLDSDW
jgi:hypothetical protein